MGDSAGGGAIAINQGAALAPAIPRAETDPMKIPLIPPTDITPEAAVVAYPKLIHTQAFPLNRYPQGALQSNVPRLYIDVEISQLYHRTILYRNGLLPYVQLLHVRQPEREVASKGRSY